MKKILHITNWYPSKRSPFQGIWIKNHIDAFHESKDEYSLWHLEVVPGKPFRLKNRKIDCCSRSIVVEIPLKQWFFVEIVTSILLLYVLLFRTRLKNYDHIHFHIAYPLLTYWRFLKKLFKKPILVSEHWSGYHFDFNVNEKKKLRRIQRIFKNDMVLLPVSESLKDDIEKFSNNKIDNYIVLPNVIDPAVFYYNPAINKEKAFFMVSNFKWPKDPSIAIKSFIEFSKYQPDYHLYFAGHDRQDADLQNLIKDIGAHDKITLLGYQKPSEIAYYMNKCEAFLHCSEYETFSVVCAESVSCGTPVIASKVGGIPEFIHTSNGILVDINDEKRWQDALNEFINKKSVFNNSEISLNAHSNFSPEIIRQNYISILERISK